MSDQPLRGPVSRLTLDGDRLAWLRSRIVWIVLLCVVVVMVVLPRAHVLTLAQLPVTPTTQSGIELELPGTADGALGVLRAFDDAGKLHAARVAIRWDFLLILCYSIGFATLLEWLKGREPGRADALIGYAAWGWLLAGVLDCLENTAMLIMLSEYPTASPSPLFGVAALLGTLVSLAKWTLISAVLGYTTWEVLKAAGRALPRPWKVPSPEKPPVVSPSGAAERIPQPSPVPATPAEVAAIKGLVTVVGESDAEPESPKATPSAGETL